MADRKLLRGRYVWTGAEEHDERVVEDGAVVVDGSVIREVGRAGDLIPKYPDAELFGSGEHVVLPGLVNSHHHGYGLTTLELGIPDDWLERWLVDVRAATYPLDPYWDTLRSVTRLVRSGVTTVLHVGSPRLPWDVDSAAKKALHAYQDAGMRVAYAIGVMDQNRFVYEEDEAFLSSLPRDVEKNARETLRETDLPSPAELMDLARTLVEDHGHDPMVQILLCPLGPQWCSDDLLNQVAELATSASLGIHTHCLESPQQRAYADRTYPTGTLARLQHLGVVGPHVSLAHGVWLGRADIDICAATGMSVCHNVSSNLRLRAGIMPARELLDAGVNVAMGTDGMSLTDDDDMFQEMRLVEAIHAPHRGPHARRRVEAPDVLRMATANGALPTTFPEIGRLQTGYMADVVLIDAAPSLVYLIEAGIGVEEAIVRSVRREGVDTVLIAGRPVLAGARFVELDEEMIVNELRASAAAPRDDRSLRWTEMMHQLKPHVEAFYERAVQHEGRLASAD
jgi:5-methylthioadenosine/S-adenosylhomocysteine deaminase